MNTNQYHINTLPAVLIKDEVHEAVPITPFEEWNEYLLNLATRVYGVDPVDLVRTHNPITFHGCDTPEKKVRINPEFLIIDDPIQNDCVDAMMMAVRMLHERDRAIIIHPARKMGKMITLGLPDFPTLPKMAPAQPYERSTMMHPGYNHHISAPTEWDRLEEKKKRKELKSRERHTLSCRINRRKRK